MAPEDATTAGTATRLHPMEPGQSQQFWAAYHSTYHGTRSAALLAALVRPFLGKRILDAGGGDGSLLLELRRLDPRADVRAVDFAPKSPEVETGDLTHLRFPDKTFDTVTCSEVIEHSSAEGSEAIVAELARVLEPGGHLVLTTPYAETLAESTVSCPGCSLSFHRWGHQQSFVEADLDRLARRHGFLPLRCHPVRLNRAKRLVPFGSRFLGTGLARALMKGNGGRRTLILVARRLGS